jgi:DNA primase
VAVEYLAQRGIQSPEVIEHMRMGYAPGGCLRTWQLQMQRPLSALSRAGLITAKGHDAYSRRVTFPLEGNLYGRSISALAPPHRFLPGSKGGLYGWEQVRHCPEVILVEGLFDYAVVWQAGFHQVTCSLGIHLNGRQFRQLCDGSRTIYLAFDADTNGSGQQAAQRLSRRLLEQGATALRVRLPDGHDPNSFFVGGGDGQQFQQLLERALP